MADLSASIDDDEPSELEITPASLPVKVGNGEADEAVTFTLAGVDLLVDALDEYGKGVFDVPIPALAAGSYTLTISGATSDPDTLDFTVLADSLDDGSGVTEDDVPVVPTFTPVARWQFIDTTTGDPHSYTVPANPEKWTNPWRPTAITHRVTTAPDGNALSWQGGDRAWRFEFSGVLTTQAHYEALEFWCNLRRRFWLIDHRGIARLVTFEHFDAQARTVPNNPWVHDYSVKVIHFLTAGDDI